jgi:hypothetical protein
MKTSDLRPRPRRSRLLPILLPAVLLPAPLLAHLPLGCCVYYGQVRDDHGQPYTAGAEVVLRLGTTEVTRTRVNPALAPGVNFRLTLPLDDGQATAYAGHAARPGDPIQILLRTGGTDRLLAETRARTAGQPGDFIGVFVSTGTDEDHDGLPDAWEWELVRYSGGLLQNPAEVLPDDDFDADGMSNLDEYHAGTYAFLDYDFLHIAELNRLPEGRVRLRFLTSPGVTFQILAATDLGPDATWQPVAFGFESDDTDPHQALLGDGFYTSVTVAAAPETRFFRLVAR